MLIGQEITVIGAGIGGLAASIALAMRGARVTVLEQADGVSEVGAGIQVSPNGLIVLDALGVGRRMRHACLRSRAVSLFDGLTGRPVIRLDLATHRPDQDFLLVHRADIIAILLERAEEVGVTVETTRRVTGVEIGERVTLDLDGAGSREVGFAIGADGLHSVMRTALNGRREAFFTGQVAWRAILPALGGEPQEARVFMGPGRHFVTYPLRDGSILNVVAVEERTAWADEGWHHEDDPANLQNAFAQFAAGPRRLLERVEKVNIWGLFRHPVADRWHKGPAVILGDAAHPTLPFMAQGAVMALEDAWVLADSLGVAGLEEGAALYQARRRTRAARVIEAANGNARNYHYANPLLRLTGHTALRVANRLAPQSVLSRYDWIYDYDVTQSG